MNQKLRTAVLGVGYLGLFHAQKHKASPFSDLVGVFDASEARAQKVASDLGVEVFTNLEQLKNKVDAVTIAATTQAHYELALWCLNHGIHVNVEKPITAELRQAEELVKKARTQNLKLAVGHVERFNPAILEMKRMDFNPESFILRREGPFKTRAADVSVLHDLMIHDVDLLTWMSGSDIKDFHVEKKKVFTQTWDFAEVHVTLENGKTATLTASRVSVVPQRSIQFLKKGETLWAQLGQMEIQSCKEKTKSSEQSSEPVEMKNWTVEKVDALQAETNSFLQAVIENQEPQVTGEDGLKALAMIEKWSK
jgi:predicted dehydrogenase